MKDIIKGISKSTSGTFIYLIFSSIIIKIIALTIGTAGIGLFSLLKQTQQTITNLSTFGGQTAVIQGASYLALAEDGQVLASHFCSNDGWARRDLAVIDTNHNLNRRKVYAEYYPNGYQIEFIKFEQQQTHEGLRAAVQKNSEIQKMLAEKI